jgi:hypothetical protein
MKLLLFILVLPALGFAQPTLNELATHPKPAPKYQKPSVTWCPKEGQSGSDTELNLLKNRVDVPAISKFHKVPIDEVLGLSFVDGQSGDRNKPYKGKPKNLDSIHHLEGLAIYVEGYILYAKEGSKGKRTGGVMQGAELCNCKHTKPDEVDYHIWLVNDPADTMDKAMVVEMAPRMRADKWGRWTDEGKLQQDLDFLASQKIPVRIYGFLMFDGEHVGQLPGHSNNVRRATLWEIHPIAMVYTFQNNKWSKLY